MSNLKACPSPLTLSLEDRGNRIDALWIFNALFVFAAVPCIRISNGKVLRNSSRD